MLSVVLLIGLFGVLGATALFPLLALYQSKRWGALLKGEKSAVASLSILLPAHNEEALIGTTLSSIRRAVEHLVLSNPGIQVDLVVGADRCCDQTVRIAKSWGAEVLEFERSRGKWQVLLNLVKSCRSDVVVFADCGISWPSGLLARVAAAFEDGSVMAVAPAYRNSAGGLLEGLFWRAESLLKKFEVMAGGPVSIHGATIAYRRKDLNAALACSPAGGNWFNDDIVMPVLLHTEFPAKRIEYLSDLIVEDCAGISSASKARFGAEFSRRRRMVVGNAQWMVGLLPALWRANRLSGLLALRRVFRLLWAYWGLLLIAGLSAWLFGGARGCALVIVAIGIAVLLGSYFSGLARLCDAAFASLIAPYYVLHRSKEVVWE